MSSTTRQIPQSEWNRHKDTIVELYRHKTLKDVRAEMCNQHGFNASPWQYEMQLKRWNIRKNATREQWQQYFSNNKDCCIPASIDASGTTLPTVILGKSTASKKRASRWASGSLVEPFTSQASGSALPGHAAQNMVASISNEPIGLASATLPEVQGLFTNIPNTFGGAEVLPVQTEPVFSSMVATSDFLGNLSPEPFDVVSGDAQSLDLSLTSLRAFSSPAAPYPQSPLFGRDSWDGAVFQDVGLPSENNMMFFNMLKNIDVKQKLPFAQLEHILRSKGIVLDKAAAHTIFGGFAPRYVAGILSSKEPFIVRKTPNLQHFLRKLSSQVPGESSALITDDQAFETKFARVLLFSVLNGFSGLDDVPMEDILRFLNRFVVNKLLLDILERCPRHVSRTLADNIFRAAIEATDTNVVKLLLDYKFVDVNETVCFHEQDKWTPIQRASELGSPRLMQALVDAGADVNKFYVSRFATEGYGGALYSLKSGLQFHLNSEMPFYRNSHRRSTVPPEPVEAFNILFAAGARVCPELMILDDRGRAVEFDLLVSQNVPSESHRGFFENARSRITPKISPLRNVAMWDERSATIWVRTVISLCHEANCNKCHVDFGDHLKSILLVAAETGKTKLVQLLLDKADLEPELPRIFSAAIRSQNRILIDFILSKAPNLDPPAENKSTPISEAVRYCNVDLVRRLEEGGSLDQLSEGGRFKALVNAAAEAGNTAYMRMLLTRAVTSKQAYRIGESTLYRAIDRGHQDIAKMLLDAGALGKLGHSSRSALIVALQRSNAQIVPDLIAAGALISDIRDDRANFTMRDRSVILDLVHEHPGLRVDLKFLHRAVSVCIELDALESSRDILQTLKFEGSLLDDCLKLAVECGETDLVECLLDMGANPFNDRVLQAAIPEQPDMLRLLFQKDRLRQTMPECIGARILVSVMGNGAGNAEALDGLIRTEAINFTRLETLDEHSALADVRVYWDSMGTRFTPLGLAIQGVHGKFDTNMDAMKKFLDAGADPDGISKSDDHWTKGSPLMTALMAAIDTDREDAVNMLLDYGAEVDARPRIRTTRTALQYAAELGNMDMVRLLLSRGADVNSSASSRGGGTALQFAAMSGNCNMVAYLLDHGAQLDALPSRIDGMWPLEGAAANGRLDMIRYLWELNVTAVRGGTFPKGFLERQCLRAMNFARGNGHIGCMELVSDLSGVSVDRLKTDEYGAPWIAY